MRSIGKSALRARSRALVTKAMCNRARSALGPHHDHRKPTAWLCFAGIARGQGYGCLQRFTDVHKNKNQSKSKNENKGQAGLHRLTGGRCL